VPQGRCAPTRARRRHELPRLANRLTVKRCARSHPHRALGSRRPDLNRTSRLTGTVATDRARVIAHSGSSHRPRERIRVIQLFRPPVAVLGVDAEGNVVIRRQLKRRYVLAFFRKLPPCVVGLEALRVIELLAA
jgi:hypothetical protein